MSLTIDASSAELAQTGTVISPQFCAPQPTHLVFVTQAPWLKDNHVTVIDNHGKFILWSGDSPCFLGRKKILCDTHNNPLLCMREKTLTTHKRWRVFIGDSSDDGELSFSIRKSSMFQTKPEFDVFLASNKGEKFCDFKIKGSYRQRTCTVHKGDSQMALAKMSKEHDAINLPQEKHIFGVHINPNTDYCFIATLIVILHEIYHIEDIAAGNATEIAGEAIGAIIAGSFSS